MRLADDALYEAKAKGRNCSVIAATEAAHPGTAKAQPVVRVSDKQRSSKVGVLASLASDDDPSDR